MLIIVLILQTDMMNDEFKQGIEAFNGGYYRIAESYFSNIVAEYSFDPRSIDARYYLSRIYESRDDLISQISATDFFLREYPYDQRGLELLQRLIRRFIDIGSFSMAVEYIGYYDYLTVDSVLQWKVAMGLLGQGKDSLADFLLAVMPQTDTVLVLRAGITDSLSVKENLYRTMNGPDKYIYLAELTIASGETLKAYDWFSAAKIDELDQDTKFRYARLSMFFDHVNAPDYIDQLDDNTMLNKKMLLKALYRGKIIKVKPRDRLEYSLLVDCLEQELAPICSLDADVPVSDLENNLVVLDSLRLVHGHCFFIDSAYCAQLLKQGDYDRAAELMEGYRDYTDTRQFYRQVLGQFYFHRQEYERSAVNLISAGHLSTDLQLMLARSLVKTERKELVRYESLLNEGQDTLIRAEARRDLIVLLYEDRKFDRVLKMITDGSISDTTVTRIMVNCYAGTGKIELAESIAVHHQIDLRLQIVDFYTDYLIETKNYSKARRFLDSVITTDTGTSESVNYKWALLPFIQGDHETALERFQSFLKKFPDGRYDQHACFKIATIMYFSQSFSSAGEYYAIAAGHDSLANDALKNQMICAKKGAQWRTAIDAGKRLLSLVGPEEQSELLYDIGYAYLRSGRFRPAIEYFLQSVHSKPEPAALYWLAEAYFGRGDFIRALYYYRRIADRFPDDEMWVPTASYKTGLVLEFMDETDEAIKVYESIIKKRGSQDTWGMEAQQRLDGLR